MGQGGQEKRVRKRVRKAADPGEEERAEAPTLDGPKRAGGKRRRQRLLSTWAWRARQTGQQGPAADPQTGAPRTGTEGNVGASRRGRKTACAQEHPCKSAHSGSAMSQGGNTRGGHDGEEAPRQPRKVQAEWATAEGILVGGGRTVRKEDPGAEELLPPTG